MEYNGQYISNKCFVKMILKVSYIRQNPDSFATIFLIPQVVHRFPR